MSNINYNFFLIIQSFSFSVLKPKGRLKCDKYVFLVPKGMKAVLWMLIVFDVPLATEKNISEECEY